MREMVLSNVFIVFMLKFLRYVGNIIGSNVYWYKVRSDFKMIIIMKGVLIIFFILLLVDMYWLELYFLFLSKFDFINENRR